MPDPLKGYAAVKQWIQSQNTLGNAPRIDPNQVLEETLKWDRERDKFETAAAVTGKPNIKKRRNKGKRRHSMLGAFEGNFSKENERSSDKLSIEGSWKDQNLDKSKLKEARLFLIGTLKKHSEDLANVGVVDIEAFVNGLSDTDIDREAGKLLLAQAAGASSPLAVLSVVERFEVGKVWEAFIAGIATALRSSGNNTAATTLLNGRQGPQTWDDLSAAMNQVLVHREVVNASRTDVFSQVPTPIRGDAPPKAAIDYTYALLSSQNIEQPSLSYTAPTSDFGTTARLKILKDGSIEIDQPQPKIRVIDRLSTKTDVSNESSESLETANSKKWKSMLQAQAAFVEQLYKTYTDFLSRANEAQNQTQALDAILKEFESRFSGLLSDVEQRQTELQTERDHASVVILVSQELRLNVQLKQAQAGDKKAKKKVDEIERKLQSTMAALSNQNSNVVENERELARKNPSAFAESIAEANAVLAAYRRKDGSYLSLGVTLLSLEHAKVSLRTLNETLAFIRNPEKIPLSQHFAHLAKFRDELKATALAYLNEPLQDPSWTNVKRAVEKQGKSANAAKLYIDFGERVQTQINQLAALDRRTPKSRIYLSLITDCLHLTTADRKALSEFSEHELRRVVLQIASPAFAQSKLGSKDLDTALDAILSNAPIPKRSQRLIAIMKSGAIDTDDFARFCKHQPISKLSGATCENFTNNMQLKDWVIARSLQKHRPDLYLCKDPGQKTFDPQTGRTLAAKGWGVVKLQLETDLQLCYVARNGGVHITAYHFQGPELLNECISLLDSEHTPLGSLPLEPGSSLNMSVALYWSYKQNRYDSKNPIGDFMGHLNTLTSSGMEKTGTNLEKRAVALTLFAEAPTTEILQTHTNGRAFLHDPTSVNAQKKAANLFARIDRPPACHKNAGLFHIEWKRAAADFNSLPTTTAQQRREKAEALLKCVKYYSLAETSSKKLGDLKRAKVDALWDGALRYGLPVAATLITIFSGGLGATGAALLLRFGAATLAGTATRMGVDLALDQENFDFGKSLNEGVFLSSTTAFSAVTAFGTAPKVTQGLTWLRGAGAVDDALNISSIPLWQTNVTGAALGLMTDASYRLSHNVLNGWFSPETPDINMSFEGLCISAVLGFAGGPLAHRSGQLLATGKITEAAITDMPGVLLLGGVVDPYLRHAFEGMPEPTVDLFIKTTVLGLATTGASYKALAVEIAKQKKYFDVMNDANRREAFLWHVWNNIDGYASIPLVRRNGAFCFTADIDSAILQNAVLRWLDVGSPSTVGNNSVPVLSVDEFTPPARGGASAMAVQDDGRWFQFGPEDNRVSGYIIYPENSDLGHVRAFLRGIRPVSGLDGSWNGCFMDAPQLIAAAQGVDDRSATALVLPHNEVPANDLARQLSSQLAEGDIVALGGVSPDSTNAGHFFNALKINNEIVFYDAQAGEYINPNMLNDRSGTPFASFRIYDVTQTPLPRPNERWIVTDNASGSGVARGALASAIGYNFNSSTWTNVTANEVQQILADAGNVVPVVVNLKNVPDGEIDNLVMKALKESDPSIEATTPAEFREKVIYGFGDPPVVIFENAGARPIATDIPYVRAGMTQEQAGAL